MTSRGLTPAQRSAFFRALNAAAVELGIASPAGREEYRRRVMREETGREHLAQLNRTTDFDKCMRRFSEDAVDYAAAARYAVGDVYRLAVMISICCAQIMQLRGDPVGSLVGRQYLKGVLDQARICHDENAESFWMDVPQDTVMSVFQMLDTHRRRLLRPFLKVTSDGFFLKFDPSARYEPQPAGGIRIKIDRELYRDYTGIKVNIRGGAQ